MMKITVYAVAIAREIHGTCSWSSDSSDGCRASAFDCDDRKFQLPFQPLFQPTVSAAAKNYPGVASAHSNTTTERKLINMVFSNPPPAMYAGGPTAARTIAGLPGQGADEE